MAGHCAMQACSLGISRHFLDVEMSRTGRRFAPQGIADTSLADLLSDDSESSMLTDDIFESSDGCDESIDVDYFARVHSHVRPIPHEGDIVQAQPTNIQVEHKNARVLNWASLPTYEFERRWRYEFRICVSNCSRCQPKMEPNAWFEGACLVWRVLHVV
jgi:hypothetical protein